MTEADDRLLLNAALDGELDAAGILEVEHRLAADPALKAEYANLKALREAIGAHAARDPAPPGLRERAAAMASSAESHAPRNPPPASARNRWVQVAAAAAVIALCIATYAISRPAARGDDATRAVVAGYMRAQMSDHPVDVASSDRHTVKPWLASKMPSAATVADLGAQGFPLLGGRIDIVAGAAVPTIVYQRREHLVSVTELVSTTSKYGKEARADTIDGHAVLAWSDRDRSYIAVSDMPRSELDVFVAAFRRAVADEREGPAPPSAPQ